MLQFSSSSFPLFIFSSISRVRLLSSTPSLPPSFPSSVLFGTFIPPYLSPSHAHCSLLLPLFTSSVCPLLPFVSSSIVLSLLSFFFHIHFMLFYCPPSFTPFLFYAHSHLLPSLSPSSFLLFSLSYFFLFSSISLPYPPSITSLPDTSSSLSFILTVLLLIFSSFVFRSFVLLIPPLASSHREENMQEPSAWMSCDGWREREKKTKGWKG